MQKRGLSGVVTTVLIILLVLVAIGIIWAAVRGPIQDVGTEINAECLTVDIEPVNCVKNPANATYDANWIRNTGTGTVTAVKVIFRDVNGQTEVVDVNGALGVLESGSVGYEVALTAAPISFGVAAVVTPEGGETTTCPEDYRPVQCS